MPNPAPFSPRICYATLPFSSVSSSLCFSLFIFLSLIVPPLLSAHSSRIFHSIVFFLSLFLLKLKRVFLSPLCFLTISVFPLGVSFYSTNLFPFFWFCLKDFPFPNLFPSMSLFLLKGFPFPLLFPSSL